MKVALCLRGGVSRKHGGFENESSPYINYIAVANSIYKHIINCNPGISFDIFIHSWNPDLKNKLIELYNPVSAEFELNSMYNEYISSRLLHKNRFSQLSQALTMKKVLQLVEKYETDNIFRYDTVILYRPDVLLWKDMLINTYNNSNIVYVNGHSNSNGDFHFVMNSDKARQFQYLFESNNTGNPCEEHSWIKNFILTYMKTNIVMDSILPGKHQEVLRKINHSIECGYISLDIFNSYGFNNKIFFE